MEPQFIELIYENISAMLAGDPKPFLDMWDKCDDASLLMSLGERDFGWECVSSMLKQVSTIVGSSPVKSIVLPELQHSCAGNDMAYAVVLEKVEAVVPNRKPEVHHFQRGTLVFRKVEGAWKIVHYHSDAISPQQEALSFILRHPHLSAV